MTKSEWFGYERLDFEFEGRAAILVCPRVRDERSRWLYKTEYFGAFPELELMMLDKGYHVAYLANKTRWVKEDDIEVKERFCAYLNDNFGLHYSCVPVGMSCGGMHAVYFAALSPRRVAALYIEAPVLNYLSCPFALGDATCDSMIEEFLAATGRTLSQMLNYREHPIDKAPALIAAGIPLFISGGDSDEIVPYHENGALLAAKYRESDIPIEERVVKGRGHHPHSHGNLSEVAEFIERYYK